MLYAYDFGNCMVLYDILVEEDISHDVIICPNITMFANGSNGIRTGYNMVLHGMSMHGMQHAMVF